MQGTKTTAHSQIVPSDLLKKYLEQKDVFYQTTIIWTVDDSIKSIIGDKLYSEQIPVGRIMNNGSIATFGSDSIDGPIAWNAFLNIFVGIKRGENPPHFFPSNNDGITVSQGVDGYTINGAKQQRADDNIGSITAGKSADFVIISHDIFNIPTRKILTTKVLETWFRGEIVYKK